MAPRLEPRPDRFPRQAACGVDEAIEPAREGLAERLDVPERRWLGEFPRKEVADLFDDRHKAGCKGALRVLDDIGEDGLRSGELVL